VKKINTIDSCIALKKVYIIQWEVIERVAGRKNQSPLETDGRKIAVGINRERHPNRNQIVDQNYSDVPRGTEWEAAMERAELNPNDDVIFLSPFTGKESKVSYRGEFNGKAMIWTGMTQFAVEYRDLVRRA
jgi:hypothetical protein